jgi:hypothetical protein
MSPALKPLKTEVAEHDGVPITSGMLNPCGIPHNLSTGGNATRHGASKGNRHIKIKVNGTALPNTAVAD